MSETKKNRNNSMRAGGEAIPATKYAK